MTNRSISTSRRFGEPARPLRTSSAPFPGATLQCCTTHLKHNLLGRVCNDNKEGRAGRGSRQVFRTGDCSYTVERAWEQWQVLCEKWGHDYRSFRQLSDNQAFKASFT